MTRRTFAKVSTMAAGAAIAPFLTVDAGAAADDVLQSEFLIDLVIETGSANVLGADRVVVPVSGSFAGRTDRWPSTSASSCRPMTRRRFR